MSYWGAYGHNVIAIAELFQIKKEKLEQKLITFCSELQKYESELEKVKGRQNDVPQHKESTMKAIDDYFKRTISTFSGLKQELLDNVDAKTSADINVPKDQQNTLQNYIKNIREYMSNFQNEDLQEKIAFIFYTHCSTDDIPKECPSFSSPGMLKYSEGCLEKSFMRRISGNLWKSPKNSKLLKKEELQTIKIVELDQEHIESLCYDSGFYWVFLSNNSSFMKYNEDGSCVEKIQVDIKHLKNKPFCVVDMEGVHAVYRKDPHKLFMIKDSTKELFIDVAPAPVVCVCITRDGDILAGLVHSTASLFRVARFNLKGECKYSITHAMNLWSPETLYRGNAIRAYMAENINTDICLSIEDQIHVIYANGVHRFFYSGISMPQPFLPRGLCTNTLGHILVADENNLGIHVLDKDGRFLVMLTIPDEAKVAPTSLCTDNQMNLCIGCADGKIRILKYLD